MNRGDIVDVNADRGSLVQELNAHQYVVAPFTLEESRPQSGQGATLHDDPGTLGQIGVRFVSDSTGREPAQRINFLRRNGDGLALIADDVHHTGELQDGKLILGNEVRKAITGEQWMINRLAPVLPVADTCVQWKNLIDSLLSKSIPHHLLVTAEGADGEPRFLRVYEYFGTDSGHSFALSVTGWSVYPPLWETRITSYKGVVEHCILSHVATRLFVPT